MKKDVEIEKLMVNPENYRFDPVDNQSEAINLMLEEKGEEILTLAKHILKYGIDKSKDSRITEVKKDLYLVLDGNRRVTAVKCLHDPYVISSQGLRKKFLDILKGNSSAVPDKVNCHIYKSEAEAAEWIRLDHTGKNDGAGQVPWEAAGTERFNYKFGGVVSPAMQMVNFYEEETKTKVPKKAVKITTLNRILSNPESRSYLGVDVKNGAIVINTAKKEFLSRLGRLFDKIIIDDVAVATVYTTDKSIDFMSKLYGSKPKLISGKSTLKKQKKGGTSKQTTPHHSAQFIPSSIVCRSSSQRVCDVFEELQKLSPEMTNSYSITIRLLIELATVNYLHKTGEYKIFEASATTLAKKKGKNLSKTFPMLSESLDWIADNDSRLSAPTKKAIKRYCSKSTTGPDAVLSELNELVHNPSYSISKREIGELWKKWADYLAHILAY